MRAIRLKVCLSFNISCALRAINVPKFIGDCEVYPSMIIFAHVQFRLSLGKLRKERMIPGSSYKYM